MGAATNKSFYGDLWKQFGWGIYIYIYIEDGVSIINVSEIPEMFRLRGGKRERGSACDVGAKKS